MNTHPKKILIVDDDDDIRAIVSLILDGEGYEVVELDNGHQVLETVQNLKPDVILLDVLLGDMDGRDVCKALKNQPNTHDIPIIIVSATHGWHTRTEKNCGADDYIGKPFDIADLVSHIKHYAA